VENIEGSDGVYFLDSNNGGPSFEEMVKAIEVVKTQ